MACENMGLLISRVIDGEASPDDARKVSEHIEGCATCREELAELRANETQVAAALHQEAFGDSITREVMRRLPVRPQVRASEPSPWLAFAASPTGAAAALLLCLAGFFAWQTIELQRILAQASLSTAPSNQPPDREVVRQYAELSRQYQQLAEQLIQALGRTHTPDPAATVVRDPEPFGESPQDSPAAQRETILREEPVVKSAPDGSLQVAAALVEDGIQVEWNVAQAVQPTGFRLYRRAAAEPEFAEPIELGSGEQYFVDRDLKPRTRYIYKVEAVTPAGAPRVVSPEVALEASGDLRVKFIGIGVATGARPEEARLRVSRWVRNGWLEQTFVVRPGETIGHKVQMPELGEVDFSTGWTLIGLESRGRIRYTQETSQIQVGLDGKPVRQTRQKEWVQNEPWVELLDRSEKRKGLWKGDAAAGTVDSIEQ